MARRHGVIVQGKCKKWEIKKLIERENHVQEDSDVVQKYVKMFCNTNQCPSLPFCGPHTKPHGVRGTRKHYHMLFDTELGDVICAIRRITCTCAELVSMLYKPWIYGLTPHQKPL